MSEAAVEHCTDNAEKEREEAASAVPDGGFGWVICFAGFTTHFLVDGISACFGIHLLSYQDYFDASIANISLANALRLSILLIQGPLLGKLANSFSCRQITVVGAVISAVSMIVSAYSSTLSMFCVSFGVFGGIGFGMIVIPPLLEISNYFDKKRAMALGIATSGTGIGTLVIAPLARYFDDELGWSGTHCIYAASLLQCCVIGALMRPLRRKDVNRLNRNHQPQIKTFVETEMSSKESLSLDSQPLAQSMCALASDVEHIPADRLHCSELLLQSGHITKEEITYRFQYSSMYTIPNFKSKHERVTSNCSSTNRSGTHKMQWRDVRTEMVHTLTYAVGILKDQTVISLCLANLLGSVAYQLPVMFSSNRAIQYGVSKENASLLLAIYGISNTVGRLLFGFVLSCIPKLSALLLITIGAIVSALALILTTLCTSFTAMLITLSIHGLFVATFVSLLPILICDIFGLDKLSAIFGLVLLAQGVAVISGPPLAGLLYDLTGNYDNLFYCAGGCMFVSAIFYSSLHKRACNRC